jgi:hypothetical protein
VLVSATPAPAPAPTPCSAEVEVEVEAEVEVEVEEGKGEEEVVVFIGVGGGVVGAEEPGESSRPGFELLPAAVGGGAEPVVSSTPPLTRSFSLSAIECRPPPLLCCAEAEAEAEVEVEVEAEEEVRRW